MLMRSGERANTWPLIQMRNKKLDNTSFLSRHVCVKRKWNCCPLLKYLWTVMWGPSPNHNDSACSSYLPWHWCCHGPSMSHSTAECAGCGSCSRSWCHWCSSSPRIWADQKCLSTHEGEVRSCEQTGQVEYISSAAATHSVIHKTHVKTIVLGQHYFWPNTSMLILRQYCRDS